MYWPTGSASKISTSTTITHNLNHQHHRHHHQRSFSTSSSSSSSSSSQQYQLNLHSNQFNQVNQANHPFNNSFEHEIIGITSDDHQHNNLFITWSKTDLTVWNSKPKIALTKLTRPTNSLNRLGFNHLVKFKNSLIVILTNLSNLIIYSLENLLNHSSYNLPASSSFFSTGPAQRIQFPKIVLKLLNQITLNQKINCFEITSNHILIGISHPNPQLKIIPWPQNKSSSNPSTSRSIEYLLKKFDWLIDQSVSPISLTYSDPLNLYILITSDGRAYIIYQPEINPHQKNKQSIDWLGQSIHNPIHPNQIATGACSINFRFNLIAIGLQNGSVDVYKINNSNPSITYSHSLNQSKNPSNPIDLLGNVNACAWTSDGHALAVSWPSGFSVWSVFGRLQIWSTSLPAHQEDDLVKFDDYFMGSGRGLIWGPGNFELILLTDPSSHSNRYIPDDQLFVLPFAKSAVSTLHSPDNTKHAFLQLEDRVSVYRGANSPDMSVINPEADIWHHIKLPADYISKNWPIESSCISDDGKLLAVAGQRGFTHFNLVSGRWKLFEREEDEQAICVRGGMQWFENTLVLGIDQAGMYSIRLFARENPLSLAYCLYEHSLSHSIVLLSIYNNSLLVYTIDNTLHHFLIKNETIVLCGSIGFEGVVKNPPRVRGMSWLIPNSQHYFGDPANDLNFATIIFLIDGKVVLLRPRKSKDNEVKYDLQILADHIEFYWAGRPLRVGSCMLEHSLWGWDGEKIIVWLDALTIEENRQNQLQMDNFNEELSDFKLVKGTLTIPLNFHPLSVLMDKGIIIGVENETLVKKSLNFAIFRIVTKTHLFIHHIIRFYLSQNQMSEAVEFGSYYSGLVYFKHSLEILLHSVLEDEAESNRTKFSLEQETLIPKKALPLVADFLDHFPVALEVVVGCARKTDVKLWKYLFETIGEPRKLFEKSLELGLLKVAASYLLVLHYSDQVELNQDDLIKLFKTGLIQQDWELCKELIRFSFSLDHTGNILRKVLNESDININLIE
ncbi:hypothetical protein O181_029921 [Austropuccinia psidii MF-1]|uniref:RIC1 C-terminal alpha solenoid region domain-containing protein n=1 Tax=Austropuccinia psidii MF-1 TaxID=1389203 RepID=A0A9Q3CXF9_9BASI|nr:hypothetical protein [Austropuccinia psidii MF-1]